MPVRQKKLLLVLAFPVFLLLYMGAVLAIADHLPANRLVELLFYVLAGTVWAFPLKPVLLWVNRPPE